MGVYQKQNTKRKDFAEEDKREDCSPGWSEAKAVRSRRVHEAHPGGIQRFTALAPDHPGLQSSLLSYSTQSFFFLVDPHAML